MKFLIFFLLAIIALSNCEDLQVLVKNFEAKISSLLAAKNFDGLSKYLKDDMQFYVNKVQGGPKQDFINYLENGTFTLFNGVGPNDVPGIGDHSVKYGLVSVVRNLTDGRMIDYSLIQSNGTEFGYLLNGYFDANTYHM